MAKSSRRSRRSPRRSRRSPRRSRRSPRRSRRSPRCSRRSPRRSRRSPRRSKRSPLIRKSGYSAALSSLRKITEKDVGKVLLFVYFLNKPTPRTVWITDYRDGKFYGRNMKRGVMYADMDKKRDADFIPEKAIPSSARVWKSNSGH